MITFPLFPRIKLYSIDHFYQFLTNIIHFLLILGYLFSQSLTRIQISTLSDERNDEHGIISDITFASMYVYTEFKSILVRKTSNLHREFHTFTFYDYRHNFHLRFPPPLNGSLMPLSHFSTIIIFNN